MEEAAGDRFDGLRKRTWRRVLYEKQPYRDNFYDPDKFFSELTITKGGTLLSSGAQSSAIAFSYASMVLQQFSSVAFFFVHYKYLVQQVTSFSTLLKLNIALLLMGTLIYFIFSDIPNKGSYLLEKAKVTLLLIICLRLTAPIIQTLTLSFSGDTIYALAITFSVVHLVLHDYSPPSAPCSSDSDPHSATLSFNAAIFTAVLLASRLQQKHSVEIVMLFILLAILTFSMFPIVSKLVKHRSTALHWIVVLLQWLLTSYMVFRLDFTLFIVYEVFAAVLFIIAPLLFLYMQGVKNAYHGPWEINADIS